jgi:hypothetical protein
LSLALATACSSPAPVPPGTATFKSDGLGLDPHTVLSAQFVYYDDQYQRRFSQATISIAQDVVTCPAVVNLRKNEAWLELTLRDNTDGSAGPLTAGVYPTDAPPTSMTGTVYTADAAYHTTSENCMVDLVAYYGVSGGNVTVSEISPSGIIGTFEMNTVAAPGSVQARISGAFNAPTCSALAAGTNWTGGSCP